MAARINELKQQRIEAANAFNDVLDKHVQAAKDEERHLTDEEKAAQEAAKAEVARLDELIEFEGQRIAIDKAAAAPSPVRVGASGPQLAVNPPNLEKDPRKGFRSPREFLLAAINESGLRSASQIEDERLQLLAVTDKEDRKSAGELAYMLPVAFTPRFLAAVGSDEQGGYDDSIGGFSVATTVLPGILSVGFEGDPTAGRTQMVPMATPAVELLARTDKNHTTSVSGGFTVTRKPETVAATSSRMTMDMITLKAASLFGLAFATEEILIDSAISFVALIESGFRDQFAAHMLNEKIRGGGGNEYIGVLTADALVTQAKEGSQVADTIVANNALKMRSRCWGYGNAIWIANHDTYPQLATMTINANVGPIYHPSLIEDRPDMLLGRPIFYSEYMATLGDLGDIMLANFSQYLEGLYQPLQSAESVHVRFVNHERTFKFWLRNAGASWWNAALTPNKSASTLSPFVTLAARA